MWQWGICPECLLIFLPWYSQSFSIIFCSVCFSQWKWLVTQSTSSPLNLSSACTVICKFQLFILYLVYRKSTRLGHQAAQCDIVCRTTVQITLQDTWLSYTKSFLVTRWITCHRQRCESPGKQLFVFLWCKVIAQWMVYMYSIQCSWNYFSFCLCGCGRRYVCYIILSSVQTCKHSIIQQCTLIGWANHFTKCFSHEGGVWCIFSTTT